MQVARKPLTPLVEDPVREPDDSGGALARANDPVTQSYIDALPIAAALAALTGGGRLIEVAANALFRTASRAGLLLEPAMLGRRVRDFLESDEQCRQFGWRESETVGGRHYTARVARVLSDEPTHRCCILSLIDRTVEVDTAASLHHEMTRDSLTGLLNRAGFAEEIERLTESSGEGVAVLVVDLNRFSRINVCMGAMAGDELIITVARRLVSALRGHDKLARIGGDEFAILLKLIDGPGDALHVAKRIEGALAAPFRLSDFEISIDCAIGCAISTEGEGEGDDEDLVRHAQFALKRAKTTGRTEVYQNQAFTQARHRFSVETELRRAIENERLHLAFQPIIDLANDRVTGYEALARWTDESGTDVSPSDFIPVAEESGLIVPLGRWALDAAARTLGEWDRLAGRRLPLSMNVNLSAIQFIRDDVPRLLSDALARHNLTGDRFMLELTESAVVNDPDRAARVMASLKDLDAHLAMDDFGTGYSNLALLQRLPVDMLKIDRSFVTTMLADRDKVAIVRAVLSLADALGMKTTAEGVETVELSQTLAALGCNYGQGYHYAVPLDAEGALAFWVARGD